MSALVDAASRLADEVLLPAAPAVDRTATIPPSHLDLLASTGMYGVFAPADHGGLVDEDPVSAFRVVEELASGCLSTAFVWVQHHGAVRSVAASVEGGVRERWLDPLCHGERRAGLAVGGLRPGPPSLRVRDVPGGFVLDGESPWVTGWGLVDVLLVAARDAADTVSWLLVDAADAPTLSVSVPELSAVMASRTVTLRFDGHHAPADRLTGRLPFAEWPPRDAAGLRMNGSLSLGVAGRCARLVGGLADHDAGASRDAGVAESLAAERDACRRSLDVAGPDALPAARAAASELAMRAAAAAMVSAGARGILEGDHAERLAREAAFLLVFGSRPSIRTSLLGLLSRRGPVASPGPRPDPPAPRPDPPGGRPDPPGLAGSRA
jgi:alkylation response protein AidB-like acyl-CoA dehydrogenase